MKVFSLIPFVIGLIGYDICMDGSPELWKNGPEYVFRLRVNTSLHYEEKSEWYSSNITIIMKCRAFSTSSEEITNGLQCHIHNVQYNEVNANNSIRSWKPHFFEPISILGINNKTFEIIYDKNGINQLKTEASATARHINLFQLIAHHLNLDALEFDQKQDSFTLDREENSVIGQCQTKIHVSTKIKFKSEQWSSECENKMYLETYAYGEKHPLVVINKTRDTSKCSNNTQFYFGNQEKYPGYNLPELSSSFTEFAIAPLSFGSVTINDGFLKPPGVTEITLTRQHIDLRLINIKKATETLIFLVQPTITNIEFVKV